MPYLRVPLLLRFFSEPSHVHALGSPKLQAALDAALFEPGLWQAEPVKTQPQRIPAPTRDHLATPAGILFNELTRSPTAVSESILALTTLALELDSGHYNPKSANCAAILYILRVASRVEGFVRTVLAANDQGKAATADLLNSDSWGNHGSMTRGLQCGPEVLTILRRCEGRLATALRRELATMVESWCDDCLAQRKLSSCCTLYAHLAFCYKQIEESELDYNSVSTLLCAHVFLGNNHTFDVEAIGSEGLKKRTPWEVGASDSLLIPATEVFELFARHRGKLLRWLDHHPAQRNVVMEAVVRTVTCTGPRNLFGAAARAALRPRRWVERPGYRGLGRYVPDTAAEAAGDHAAMTEIDEVLKEQKATASKLQAEAKDVSSVAKARTAAAAQAATAPGASAALRLEAWLRKVTTTQGADVEVNLQLGEFSLRRQALMPLPKEVETHADFITAFGYSSGPIQSVQVSATSNRRWIRLVGERHDLQLWFPDTRPMGAPAGRRSYPNGLKDRERWVQQAINAAGPAHLDGMTLSLPPHDLSEGPIAMLYAVRQPRGQEAQDANRVAAQGTSNATHGSGIAGRGAASRTDGVCLKEVVVLKDPPTVHIYDVVESGRRLFRSIVFSSDASHCLASLSPRRQEQRATSHVQRVMGTPNSPVMPAPSLVISRNIGATLGEQTYLPGRLLYGLLPTALLEMYDLWQQADDTQLRGYMKPGMHTGASDTRRTELRISLFRATPPPPVEGDGHTDGAPPPPGGPKPPVNALIQRVHLMDPKEGTAEEDEEGADGSASVDESGDSGVRGARNRLHAAAAAAASRSSHRRDGRASSDAHLAQPAARTVRHATTSPLSSCFLASMICLTPLYGRARPRQHLPRRAPSSLSSYRGYT